MYFVDCNTLGLIRLTLCMLRNVSLFFVNDFFSKYFFSKISFRNTIRGSNSLYPHQVRHFVGPDLGLNCLQMLSADDTGGAKRCELVLRKRQT